MSRRRNTRTARFRQIADDIESEHPGHAEYLRGLGLGRSGERQSDGFTMRVKRQAAHWRSIKAIPDEGDQLVSCMELTGKDEDAATNFIDLFGYDELRAYLKSQGDV